MISHYIVEGTLFPTDAAAFRWFWFTISAILGLVLGDTFLFEAYVRVGPRISTLLMSTVPIYLSIFFTVVALARGALWVRPSPLLV